MDVHNKYNEKNPSWAVINLNGDKRTYIKFVSLKDCHCKEIISFLSHFERVDIDASPMESKFMKCELGI